MRDSNDRPDALRLALDRLVRIASELPDVLGTLAAQPFFGGLFALAADPRLVLLLLCHALEREAELEVVELTAAVLQTTVPVDRLELRAERKALRPFVKQVGARRHLGDGRRRLVVRHVLGDERLVLGRRGRHCKSVHSEGKVWSFQVVVVVV